MKKIDTKFARLFLLVATLFVSTLSQAQLAMTRSIFNGAYTAIVGGTTSTAIGDDAYQQNIPVGFTFNYLGTNFTQFSVSTNGWISFANGATYDAASIDLFNTTTNNTVAPWWDDLSSSAIVYQTTGTPGSQVCTIQWTSLSYYTTSTRTINYQVKLYEGTNVIEFWYGASPTGTLYASESASIGLKSATGGNGQYLDAVTGSAFTGNSDLQSDRWPAYNFRFTPGAPTVLAGGTYNVGVGQTYINLNEAVADINHRGISGPVVLNLVDAQYDITPANGSNFFPILLGPIAGASAVNTTTITKIGTAAIISYGGPIGTAGAIANQASTTALSLNVDPIIGLVGADYVTLNNLDIRGNVGNQLSDHGVGVYNSSVSDGATNNTIQNVSVMMNRGNTGSRGFIQNVITTPTSAAGANSNNTYKDFTIRSVYAGIQMTGNAANPDLNTQIIRSTCSTFNSIGDPSTTNDIGNGTTQTYGIRMTNQSGFTIANNSIRNVSGSAIQTDGIFIELFQGVCTIDNNKIQTIRNISTASTTGIAGVRLSHATVGTNTMRFYNNAISEITSAYTGAASSARTLKGIFISTGGGSSAQTYQIYNNNVSIDGSLSLNVSSTCFETNVTNGPVFNFGNNIFANFTGTQTGISRHFCIVTPTATTFGPAGSTSNNNNLYVANDIGTTGFIGFDGTTNYNTVANWSAAVTPAGQETASLSVNPTYISNTSDLHASNLALNGAGQTPPVYITTDLDCATRTPDNDIGSYILVACSGMPTAGTITGATSVCSGSGTTLTLVGASQGAGITYQWASSLINNGPYTTTLGTSLTQATGPITQPTYYVVGVGCTISGQATVTSQFTILVNPLPSVTVTPTTASYCTPGPAIALTASGATTYAWGPAAGLSATTGSSVNASPASQTTYTVTGTDALGCVNTATTTISSGANPIVTATATPPSICSGGNSVLNANASSSATYCTGAYTTGTGFGDYITNVTLGTINNTTGASATPYSTYYNLLNTNLTAGSGYTITGTINNGGTEDVAVWIDYNQDGSFDPTEKLGEQQTLAYSIAFTVPVGAYNGVTRMRVRNVYNTIGLLPCNSYTYGEIEDYNVTISGGVTPFTYAWAPPTFLSATTGNPVNANGVTATTTYTATVTSGAGCVGTGTVTLTAGSPLSATATATPATTVCDGTNVTLSTTTIGGGAPFTFSWTGPNSFSSTLQNPSLGNVTAINAGTYTCVITDNCAATFTVTTTITVNPLPVVTVSPSSATFCAPSSPVTLTASGATTYSWGPAGGLSATTGTSVDASPAATTTYTVTGTDGNGCASTATTTITYSEAPSLSSVTATPSTICAGDNSQLNSSAGTTTAYTASNSTFSSLPCQANPGPTGDDVVQGGDAIGFNFNYYGITYTTFGLSTNGNIQLGDGSGSANNPAYSNSWTDVAIPNAGTPNNLVALAWDDWFISAGQITWGVTGSAPNRQLIVCYNTTGRGSGSADTLNGQIVLEETTNKIYFNMIKKGIQPANTATQGIENQTGTVGSVSIPGRNNVAWSTNNQTTVITPSGGPVAYSWSPSTFLSSTTIANPMANAATATTTYTLSVTSGGCATTGTVTLTVNALPIVTLSGNNNFCMGDSSLLTGTAGGTIQWYRNGVAIVGATANTYYASTSGVYNMTETNISGCTDSAAVGITITVNPLPVVTATASSTTVCSGSNVTFTGGGATTYTWNNGVTDAVPIAVTTSGYYVVTGTDANSCMNMDSVMINVNALPVVALGPDVTQCGGTVMLDAGNVGSTYLWSDNSTSQMLTASSTGTYSVTVTDANGCTGNDAIDVTINPIPVVALGNDTSVCSGSFLLDAGNPGSTYLWSDNSTAQTLAVNTSGTYSVTVTTAAGCSNSDAITLTINTSPTVSLGADITQCGGTVTLDAQNVGDTYLWSDNSTAQMLTASTSGTYWVDVTNASGCTTRDSIMITINALPIVDLGTDVTQCGGTVTLDAGNVGSTYLWSDNSTAQMLTVSASGTYFVDVTNANGCSGSDTIVVTINTPPVVTFSMAPDTICKNDAPLALTGTPAGGTFSGPGVTGSTFNPTTLNGQQTVTYSFTDVNGCSGSASDIIFVDACTGITENSIPVSNVYPNPNLGQFTIDLGYVPAQPVQVEIMNGLGQTVQSFTMTSNTKQVDLGIYAVGVYSIRITDKTNVSVVRVVKQ
jgi:hypothetical protein